MKAKDVIIVEPDKCVGCAACIRECPAPEANKTIVLDNGQSITTVDPNKCIACGKCVKACAHGARNYVDGTEEAMKLITRERVNVIVAPSIRSIYPTKWKSMLKFFKDNGCRVYDGSFGADICTWAHLRAIQAGDVGKIITQPCPAVVRYIEIYQPQLLQNLSIIHSPLCCEAIYIKKYLRQDNKIIAMTPCVAKTYEFAETELIDYNVTFKKLWEYFEKQGINISTDTSGDFNFPFDDQEGFLGGIYPRPGGLRDCLWINDPEINITNSEGAPKVYNDIDAYAVLNDSMKPDVFDVLSCEFGCNVGPGSGVNKAAFEAAYTIRQYEIAAKKRRKTTGPFSRGEDKIFKEFDGFLTLKHFRRSYKAQLRSPDPTDAQLEPIFEKMGKHTQADKNYNCHACGYKSCREMATAILRGLNSPNNCLVHAKSVLIARHSSLAKQHEALSLITSTCLDQSKELKENIESIKTKVGNIVTTAEATGNRADVVKDLLGNVITFCEQNPSMDSETVSQLIEIIKVTSESFDQLNENVTTTKDDSAKIEDAINILESAVEVINTTLLESEIESKKFEDLNKKV